MCNWFNDKMKGEDDWINNVWFSDEAHFHLDDYVSSKNCVFWGTEPLQDVLQQPLHSSKVTTWCAIISKTIIGPYWFEDDEGRTVTIIQENCRKVIRKVYESVSRRKEIVINQQWFVQDGSTPYTENTTLELLTQKFRDRVISQKTDNPWAAHSPDLKTCDFFLWGYLKEQFLCCKTQNIAGSKESNHKIYQSNPSGHVQESYWKRCNQVERMSEPLWCTYFPHLVNVKARTNCHKVKNGQEGLNSLK